MGIDIHMYICKDKKYIVKDVFDGSRNSEWFGNMQPDCNHDDTYDSLHFNYTRYGISEEAPQEYFDKYENQQGYYGYYYIKVKDFEDWFIRYRPDEDAGWVTRYEAWAYKHKGIEPEYLQKKLYKDDIIEDMKFIKVTYKWDTSAWLYSYLIDNEIPEDAIIQYCFDR